MRGITNFNDFRQAFRDYSKDYGKADQFSYKGLMVLFNYLEELEDDCGVEIEMDVVALCCGYMESSIRNIADKYGLIGYTRKAIINELKYKTQVIEIDDDNIIIEIDDDDDDYNTIMETGPIGPGE